MRIRVVFLVGAFILLAGQALGQYTELKPVIVNVGVLAIKVGCDTAQVLDRTNLGLLKEQSLWQERFIDDLINEMQPSGARRSDVKAVVKEQKAWEKAREIQCASEGVRVEAEDRELLCWSCREWAARCRLVDVLGIYDRVVPAK